MIPAARTIPTIQMYKELQHNKQAFDFMLQNCYSFIIMISSKNELELKYTYDMIDYDESFFWKKENINLWIH